MKTLRAPTVLLVLLLGLLACENREHLNPFDPENPGTGGTPSLLDARAGNGRVTLRWELGAFEGLRATRLYRRLLAQTLIESLTPSGLDPRTQFYDDLSADNGVTYEYRFELELRSGAGPVSAWDPATPGSLIPWIGDSNGGGLFRLTPDGRDPIEQVGLGWWTLDLAADTLDGAIWSVDYQGGTVYQHAGDGKRLLQFDLPGARAVDVDRDRVSVWAASFDQQRLERRLRDGTLVWSIDQVGWVEDLLAVAPDGVWLCNQGGEIRYFQDDTSLITFRNLGWPVAMAQSEQGRFFVLERAAGRVRRFLPYGIPDGASDSILVDPVDLCKDEGGGAWVVDPGRGGLVHLDHGLVEIGFIAVEGALGVTWDDGYDHLWVAGTGGVEVRDASGRILSRLRIGTRVIDVELLTGSEVP